MFLFVAMINSSSNYESVSSKELLKKYDEFSVVV
jgi:hypothetical protein